MRESKRSNRKLPVLASSLALTAVTAMAGVTGTAAWFTANRAATATASTFTAYAPKANLTIIASTGQGTFASGTDSTVYVREGSSTGSLNYLRDASYDASSKTLYRVNLSDDIKDATPVSYSEVSNYDSGVTVPDKTDTSLKHKIFYAVSWSYKFTYSNPNANGSALFFNPNTSKFIDDGSTNAIAKGFRIALNSYTAGTSLTKDSTSGSAATDKYVVFANDATLTYVNNTDAKAELGKYTAGTNLFVNGTTNYTTQYDGLKSTELTSVNTYIGTFMKSTDTITVTCTAWYEGSDSNVVTDNAKNLESITATLGFYVRDLAA